jgi:hypothetical protein
MPKSTPSPPDSESGVTELRDRHRPKRVTTLFVGESSPAQGTHFYRANSNLYRATQAAFASAWGDSAVPSGEAFLRFFCGKGCWLVDLADRPVNQLADSERRTAVAAGIPRLAELIRETKPKQLVVIKKDIAPLVDRAIEESGAKKPVVLALRYPLRQWRTEYVRELAAFVRNL